MSIKRIFAVVVIFLVAGAGWWVLGAATAFRSDTLSGRLGPQVAALWGTPLLQADPVFKTQIHGNQTLRPILPASSDVKVVIEPDHRRNGVDLVPDLSM